MSWGTSTMMVRHQPEAVVRKEKKGSSRREILALRQNFARKIGSKYAKTFKKGACLVRKRAVSWRRLKINNSRISIPIDPKLGGCIKKLEMRCWAWKKSRKSDMIKMRFSCTRKNRRIESELVLLDRENPRDLGQTWTAVVRQPNQEILAN